MCAHFDGTHASRGLGGHRGAPSTSEQLLELKERVRRMQVQLAERAAQRSQVSSVSPPPRPVSPYAQAPHVPHVPRRNHSDFSRPRDYPSRREARDDRPWHGSDHAYSEERDPVRAPPDSRYTSHSRRYHPPRRHEGREVREERRSHSPARGPPLDESFEAFGGGQQLASTYQSSHVSRVSQQSAKKGPKAPPPTGTQMRRVMGGDDQDDLNSPSPHSSHYDRSDVESPAQDRSPQPYRIPATRRPRPPPQRPPSPPSPSPSPAPVVYGERRQMMGERVSGPSHVSYVSKVSSRATPTTRASTGPIGRQMEGLSHVGRGKERLPAVRERDEPHRDRRDLEKPRLSTMKLRLMERAGVHNAAKVISALYDPSPRELPYPVSGAYPLSGSSHSPTPQSRQHSPSPSHVPHYHRRHDDAQGSPNYVSYHHHLGRKAAQWTDRGRAAAARSDGVSPISGLSDQAMYGTHVDVLEQQDQDIDDHPIAIADHRHIEREHQVVIRVRTDDRSNGSRPAEKVKPTATPREEDEPGATTKSAAQQQTTPTAAVDKPPWRAFYTALGRLVFHWTDSEADHEVGGQVCVQVSIVLLLAAFAFMIALFIVFIVRDQKD
ncbi:unnamed protein product [Vitrella brassicaformis CCMP3155]|uniref:Uncharacterized protein n=2 Tax=Vitrella brassicaformis TaxID=1169539 RepID=A0A0G4G8P0_VITBC|nr:unnamed protein product [Vitrella brassicaformis CCMP3155]|eukprot:CEM25180.1 unnamed protein product [Vitrella brassicaformis CCMP3155]